MSKNTFFLTPLILLVFGAGCLAAGQPGARPQSETAINEKNEGVTAQPDSEHQQGTELGCRFVEQLNVSAQGMLTMAEAKAEGYAVDLDTSIATGTLSQVCVLGDFDVQMIRESPDSEPRSIWMLAVKKREPQAAWKVMRFVNTLQSDYPGCEVNDLLPRAYGVYIEFRCTHSIELGDIQNKTHFYLADVEAGLIKKYAECKSAPLNIRIQTPSTKKTPFVVTESVYGNNCSVVSDPDIKLVR